VQTGFAEAELDDVRNRGACQSAPVASLVDEVIAEAGRTQQRHRSLPARVMAYFAIGMGLYSEGSYEDVLTQLTDGLAWASGWREHYRLPGKSAIFQARERLGSEPLAALFARVARPLGGPDTPGTWLADRRLVAIDGTCLDVADTPVNEGFFGRPGVNKGERRRFRKRGCWRWPRRARTRSSRPRLALIGMGRLSRRGSAGRSILRHALAADRGFFS
jgi:hypothetical protein